MQDNYPVYDLPDDVTEELPPREEDTPPPTSDQYDFPDLELFNNSVLICPDPSID